MTLCGSTSCTTRIRGATALLHRYCPELLLRPGAEPGAAAVISPASLSSTRTGNVLRLRVADFVDSSNKHHTIGEADQASATPTRDGTVLASLTDAWQDVPTTAGAATYQLTLSTARGGEDWSYGIRTDTTWTFRSGGDGPLPLLRVDYAARSTWAAGPPPGPHPRCSVDDGATGRSAAGLVPAGTEPSRCVVTESDNAGSAVTQTVIRAYGRGETGVAPPPPGRDHVHYYVSQPRSAASKARPVLMSAPVRLISRSSRRCPVRLLTPRGVAIDLPGRPETSSTRAAFRRRPSQCRSKKGDQRVEQFTGPDQGRHRLAEAAGRVRPQPADRRSDGRPDNAGGSSSSVRQLYEIR